MSIAAISAIFSRDSDPSQQQSGLRLDLRGLQKALASGNLAAAQTAFNRFQQDLQAIQPQQNGVRAGAELNAGATTKNDMEALQKALNSGDLPAAEQAFIRLQEDNQQIAAAAAHQVDPVTGQSGPSTNALPKHSPELEFQNVSSKENTQAGKGGIDVFA